MAALGGWGTPEERQVIYSYPSGSPSLSRYPFPSTLIVNFPLSFSIRYVVTMAILEAIQVFYHWICRMQWIPCPVISGSTPLTSCPISFHVGAHGDKSAIYGARGGSCGASDCGVQGSS